MPLIIPKTLPAYDALYEENVFVMHRERAASQHIRPLEILILNLMPTKIATETQIARLLANTPLQVHMTLLQTASHAATHVSTAHLEAFYKTFDEVKNNRYDGMIITGAPVETMAFEHPSIPMMIGLSNGEAIRNDIVLPKGTPALRNPTVIGMVEQAQNGVSAPNQAAITLPKMPRPESHFLIFSCGMYIRMISTAALISMNSAISSNVMNTKYSNVTIKEFMYE